MFMFMFASPAPRPDTNTPKHAPIVATRLAIVIYSQMYVLCPPVPTILVQRPHRQFSHLKHGPDASFKRLVHATHRLSRADSAISTWTRSTTETYRCD